MTRTTIIIMIYVDSDETGQLSSHGFADDELAALQCTNQQNCAHFNQIYSIYVAQEGFTKMCTKFQVKTTLH